MNTTLALYDMQIFQLAKDRLNDLFPFYNAAEKSNIQAESMKKNGIFFKCF